jgi:hypothetical protein
VFSTISYSFWDDLLDPLKVTFDGDNRKIIVNPQYTTLSVKSDIYSAAKRWLQRRQNFQYARPLRAIGGDTIGNGLYAGDIYFLTNNWQVVINTQVSVIGSLYSDNTSLNVFTVNSGGGVQSTVSNLATVYNGTAVTVPTVNQIATTVWSVDPTQYSSGTVGGKINKIDTINNNTNALVALNS